MKRLHFSKWLKRISALLFVGVLMGTVIFFVTRPGKPQAPQTISAQEILSRHNEPLPTLRAGKIVYQKTRVYPYIVKTEAPFIIHETWAKLKAEIRSNVWETEIRKEIVRDENGKVIWVKFVGHKYGLTYAPEQNLVKKRDTEPEDQFWSYPGGNFYLAFAEGVFRENFANNRRFKKVGESKIGSFKTDVFEQTVETPVDVQAKPDETKTHEEKGHAITRVYIDKENGLMRRFEEIRALGQSKLTFNRFDFLAYEILEPEEVSGKALIFAPPDGAVLEEGEIGFNPFNYPDGHLSP